MNYFCNLNSKTFFRFVREDAPLLAGYRPVSAHVNYHPEKPQRMVDLHAFYHGNDAPKGERAGIWKWNGGEGSRLQSECKASLKKGPAALSTSLAQRALAAGKAEWGGIKWIEFQAGGALKTPWGEGVWGALPEGVNYNDDGFCAANCLFADFSGGLHNVKFFWDDGRFKVFRVGDGEAIEGTRDTAA